ncbi:MAG: flagellar biosynthesis protein FlgC [Rhodospirillales bacterium]|nr:flagellar biosynthesis protein FlgC [Rhodospirillales bacterium]
MTNPVSIALSGLGASLKRIGAAASNIANVQTTGSLEPGGKKPYEAQTVVQSAQAAGGTGAGVSAEIVTKKEPFVPVYDPNSPDANAQGLIGAPNVDLAEEIVGLKLASITYRANLKVIEASTRMSEEAGRLLDEKI